MVRRLVSILTLVAACSIAVNSASAVPINYGDRVADTVVFRNITEDSGTDPTPLFEGRPGGPSVSGDTLVFQPTAAFSAQSPVGTQLADTTDGQLRFTVEAKAGWFINEITLLEFGDYSLVAIGDGEALAHVSGVMFLTIDGSPNPVQVNFAFSGTTGNPPYMLLEPGVESGGFQGGGAFDLSNFNATSVEVVLDNTLQTAVFGSAGAFIAKKGLTVTVSTIPEPASLALLAAGGLLVLRRRRR